MYYPKELEFTDIEEHFMLKQMQYDPPQQEVKDIMDYLDISDYKIKDFKDMRHLRNVILNFVNTDVNVAVTDTITYEEQIILEKKIENRKKYRTKVISDYGIEYCFSESDSFVLIAYGGVLFQDVMYYTDAEMNDRNYIVVDNTVVYLDTLKEI